MNVVPIRRRACAESVAILRHLLARAEAGEIHGLAVCAKTNRGSEDIVFAGDYRDNPQALSASLRMSWQLTMLRDG